MIPILAEIVIQNIEFFGLAADAEVHPDAAVRQLEIMSDQLKQLSTEDLRDFLAYLDRRLERLRNDGAPVARLEFLNGLRENLGLDLRGDQ